MFMARNGFAIDLDAHRLFSFTLFQWTWAKALLDKNNISGEKHIRSNSEGKW